MATVRPEVPVVVDANLVVILITRGSGAGVVSRQFREWLDSGVDMHAPELLQYEVANAFVRMAVAGFLSVGDLLSAWSAFIRIPITLHAIESGDAIVSIALALKRQNAYDAAYIALARTLDAELWTLDGPLYRNAVQIGFRVRLIE
ncbi:MAG TPA: type II toxin-antitoxin system VapC family toxin [Thermomicrobiaceae bacterium]|nr:type II toxin-antitoxin system VapC family toxin [Thermomicrobiaceae bacterium]